MGNFTTQKNKNYCIKNFFEHKKKNKIKYLITSSLVCNVYVPLFADNADRQYDAYVFFFVL